MAKRLAGLLLLALVPLTSLAQVATPPAAPPVAAPAPAAAPPPAAAPAPAPVAVPAAAYTIHRHLGFFIRPEIGFGYLSTSVSQSGSDLDLSGGGGGFAIGIGGAVSENFILAGQIWDYVAMDPTVKIDGQTVESSTSSSAALVGIGVLLNWYFMPGNWYVAVTPSLTQLTLDDGFTSVTSDWGFGARAAFGKEWWVSDHWGLGLNATLAFSSNKMSDFGGSPSFSTFSAGLNFSATYN